MTTTTAVTRGPYAKTKRVRDGILDAASEVFAASGYHATTMKEVAERAGISEGGLVHHFPSKDDLLTEVLDRRERRYADRFPGAFGLASLETMVEIVAADAAAPTIVELNTILQAEATNPDHPGHDHYVTRYANVRALVTHVFRSLEQDGALETVMTPEELGAAYVALSDGLQLQWLYHRDQIDTVGILKTFLCTVIPSLRDTAEPPGLRTSH